jgi:heme-degrading monooxygenase HmoA
MFVTMVQGAVDAAREGDLRSAWEERTSGELPTGLVESYLLRAEDGVWRVVTLWESREAVMAMRATVQKPTAILIFEQAGSGPSVSMWTVEGRVGRVDR